MRGVFAATRFAAAISLVLAVMALFGEARGEAAIQGVGHPYRLTSTLGGALTDRTYLNAVQVVLFGYTWCPDVCPTSLSSLAQARDLLGEAGRAVRVIFISVDPERDTIGQLQDYLGHFDPSFVGATGAPTALAAAARAFHTSYAVVGMGPEHTVSHSALIYVFDRQGHLAKVLHPAAAPQDMAAALRPLTTN